ncbi:SMP-30/gluconolactonase/LRE family protein [Noviherbaspirillum pedocola]|uniref:SMP-30/gluconolactonase/LRE family protein n=1 Tax=Noviherbaspirillum pedocola TaxID=2801341 RepID=A0A934SZK0_9BURK|nr:SMP-30/gluconolactonase/LRE family protein [Noviherbaspirillum pedocola]MBK4734618.1 SMP-30/gluconolactonase/LRE family protein [Noviherbaspirillum pedocola]
MSLFEPKPAFDVPMQLGESPLWHPEEQRLYWVDIEGHAVHCLDPASGEHRQWRMPAEPGCIAWNATGGMIVALRTGISHLDTGNGKLTAIAAPPYDPARERFNDGGCDAAGRFWIGTIYEPRDQPNAALYALEHGALRDSGVRATVSNGLAFSPDNATLYHADTTSHRITAYEFDLASGSVGTGKLLRQFSSERNADYGGRPDGAAVDSEGNYWCAMYEGARLLKLSPAGDILREIRLPLRCPTMPTFGGPDLRTLYITSVRAKRPDEEIAAFPLSGCVLSMEVDVPGRNANPYRA